MRDLILITNSNYDFDKFLSILKEKFSSELLENNFYSICVEFKQANELFGDSVRIEKISKEGIFYEPQEQEKINKIIHDPYYFLIHFKNIHYVKKIMEYIANREDVIVDNEFGLIITGKEFVKLCEENPNWDWAYDDIPTKNGKS